MELVRYIHLNLLRAEVVKGLEELNRSPWSGHGKNRTGSDTIRLTEALLTLLENGIFSTRQTEHARALIKTLPDDTRDTLLNRIKQIE